MVAPHHVPHFLLTPVLPAHILLRCMLRASPTDRAIPPPHSPPRTLRTSTRTANLPARNRPARTVPTAVGVKRTQMLLSQDWMGLSWPTPAMSEPVPTPATPALPAVRGPRARATPRPHPILAWALGTSPLSHLSNQDTLSTHCPRRQWATTAPL